MPASAAVASSSAYAMEVAPKLFALAVPALAPTLGMAAASDSVVAAAMPLRPAPQPEHGRRTMTPFVGRNSLGSGNVLQCQAEAPARSAPTQDQASRAAPHTGARPQVALFRHFSATVLGAPGVPAAPRSPVGTRIGLQRLQQVHERAPAHVPICSAAWAGPGGATRFPVLISPLTRSR